MQTVDRKQFVLVVILLGLLVTIILLPRSPLQRNVPPRDSGVFLYIGQQILDGQIPYRDMWDHKGPGIYYLNAFGLYLVPDSRWGVWWLQWLALMTAAILGYKVLNQTFGSRPAIFASLAWLTTLVFVLDGGNYTEEYELAVQFGALFLFWESQESARPYGYVFLIGVTLAVAFWIRPNSIGIHLSVVVVALVSLLLSPHRWKALIWIIFLSTGFLAISIPLLGYFAWVGAWDEFVDAVFRYNFIYTTSDLESKLNAMMEGLKLLTQTGITFIVMAAWVIGCFSLFSKPRQTGAYMLLRNVALFGLPVELLLASSSGRTYSHYYITWLPIFALLTAQLTFDFLNYFTPVEISLLQRKAELKSVWPWAILFAMILPVHQEIFKPVVELLRGEYATTSPVVKSIWNYTDEGDTLLMWGAETKYNFMSDRKAPSRFIYQYPLYTCGYVTDAMVAEFLLDIERNKPLIIDTSSTNKYVPPLDADNREKWNDRSFAGFDNESCRLSPRMADVFAFIDAHYHVVEIIQSKNWPIYQYTNAP